MVNSVKYALIVAPKAIGETFTSFATNNVCGVELYTHIIMDKYK